MEADLKPYNKVFNDILEKPCYGIGSRWIINRNKELLIKGNFVFSGLFKSKQSFSYTNPNLTIKTSFHTDKIYKFSGQIYSLSSPIIIPTLEVKFDYLNNSFLNIFSAANIEKNRKVVLGLKNTGIFLYCINNWKNLGFAGKIFGSPADLLDLKFEFASWWISNKKKVLFKIDENLEICGSYYYKFDSSKEIAGKITMNQSNVQMLFAIKKQINESQIIKVRLDSEGFIGFQLNSDLSKNIGIRAYTEISVKQLAKNNNDFVGFGINFEFNN